MDQRRRLCSGPPIGAGVYDPVVPMVPNFASARQTASVERDCRRRILCVEHAPVGEHQPVCRDAERVRPRRRRAGSRARSAASIAALPIISVTRLEYEPRSTGVRSVSPVTARMSSGSMPSTLGDARHEHIVGSLADFGGAAEDRDAAAAIELQLHAGVRHVVPVDRQAGARQVRRAGQADAPASAAACGARRPVRRGDNPPDALGEPDGADAQVVGGQRLGRSTIRSRSSAGSIASASAILSS